MLENAIIMPVESTAELAVSLPGAVIAAPDALVIVGEASMPSWREEQGVTVSCDVAAANSLSDSVPKGVTYVWAVAGEALHSLCFTVRGALLQAVRAMLTTLSMYLKNTIRPAVVLLMQSAVQMRC